MTRLSGIVADMNTGSPVVEARVTVEGTNRGTLTTIRGSYFLDDVDIGRGWRTVHAEKTIGGQLWSGERAVLFDPDISVQSNLLIMIAPANRKGTIRGRVTTAGGAGLQNVTVFLNPETSVAAAFRITDSVGRYEFEQIPAGTYTVVASARDLVNSGASQVILTPSTTVTVDLSMLVTSSVGIAAPGSLEAQAFTYPDNAAGVQARLRAIHRWLQARYGPRRAAQGSRRVRVQDWPAGSIIEVDLFWDPPAANDLAGYVLERAVSGGAFGVIDRFADPTASAYYDLDPLYTPDQVYQFRLSAASTSGFQSIPSNTTAARPLAPLESLSPSEGADVTPPPTFSWRPVARAQQYQVLVLSRPPDLTDLTQMPLVWPTANNLAAAQTTSTQLAYGGPALQPGTVYYWVVYAFDQPDPDQAEAISASPLRSFTAR